MNKLSFIPKNVIVAILLATLIVNVIETCPVVCTCKWKGGKRKVECVDKNLTSLLTNIDTETQVLDYSSNRLEVIESRLFEKVNLINLQKLYVPQCHISEVQETAFSGLTNLIELDMSANALTELPSAATFADTPQLMKLTISANPIRVLHSGAFAPLKYLSTLDLSNCQLETIDSSAFDGLHKLEWLKLDGNQLKNVKSPYTLPVVTGGLSLHHNPWRCDCHLRHFRRWLTDGNHPKRLTGEPVCADPSVHRSVQVQLLKNDDLACAPYVVPSSLFVEINEGKNISFVCQVSAVPEASITWEFEGNPVSDNSSFVYPFYKYYVEENTTEQVSELFVFDAKKENNGTYRCTAQNIAGTSTSNYTLNVIVVQTEVPQTLTVSHLHVLFSSVSTLVVVVFVVLLIILCLIYTNHKKTSVNDTRDTKRHRTESSKLRAEYEIVKQASSACDDKSNSTATAAGVATRTDTNPDLIINTDNNNAAVAAAAAVAAKEMEACERLLLLPGEIKQTYVTLAGNTLLNTTIYESKTICPHNHHDTAANQVTLIPATAAASVAPVSNDQRTGTIKLYLAPNTAQKFHNLHVNPFDGYVDSIEPNCWTLELAEDDVTGETRHVLIDCYSQSVCPKAQHLVTSCGSSSSSSNGGEFVNLRHNLEGYPYPSKLKLKSLKPENSEIVDTPILSPPDPFKTGTELPQVHVETTVNL